MPTEFVMLPPHSEKTREWGSRLAAELPDLKVVVAENHTHAAQVIAHADSIPSCHSMNGKRIRPPKP